MSDSKRLGPNLSRDLYILEDESNPRGTQVNKVYPSSTLDQIFDQTSPTNKTLRQILEELKQEIITGGKGNIVFPVTSVNGKTEDVILTANDLGLGRVDNTRDANKPLSGPQKEAMMEILSRYDFKVNLDDIYEHVSNFNNPHDVTLEQINRNDALGEFVKQYIGLHNNSRNANVHPDIRKSLSGLWKLVEESSTSTKDNVDAVMDSLDTHYKDPMAHNDIMNMKESIENKAMSFSTTIDNDHTKYPSTRAVADFVADRLSEFKKTLPDVKDWISDITVIDDRSKLPPANARYVRSAFFIRTGTTSHDEVAICRMNPDDKTYSWDISQLGSISKFHPDHFTDTSEGLSIRMDKVIDAIISDQGMLDTSLSEILKDYYTKNEIDTFKFIGKIKILPGTQDGTIRYYINDDMTTMSEDVKVSGLKRLAYLEWITEDQLWDQSVHARHIISKAIEKRHLNEKIIGPENMTCEYGFLLGNTEDSTGDSVNKVALTKLADWLRPLIGGWPDPNVPGGNPWSDMLAEQIMHPHLWETGKEHPLGDHSYAMRFTGKISVVPNMDIKTQLTNKITLGEYRMIEAGGAWEYQSNPSEWTILGGSNITGHTFATINMTSKGLFLESISTGNRFNAEYDVWVKYVKPAELDQLLHPQV